MSWTETKVTSAADEVSRLSEFLALDEFEPKALRYLTDTHMSKFLKAIEEEEATQIVRLIGEPQVTETTPSAQGFEILDWLRVVGPIYEWQGSDLDVSSNVGTGVCLLLCRDPQNQSTQISRHLAYMRRAGIVGVRRDGSSMHYRIVEPPDTNAARLLKDVLAWLASDRELLRDRGRLVRLCCAPQLPVSIQGAPRPASLSA
ncbi:MAG: ArsR/SmtB family transcription factor [Burkholderiales bacterium]